MPIHHWSGPNDTPGAERLRVERWVNPTDEAQRTALAQLGIPELAIGIRTALTPPEAAYAEGQAGPYGASLHFEVLVCEDVDGRSRQIFRTATRPVVNVRDAERSPLAMPWPVSENESNVFADRTGTPYAVRAQLVPITGLYLDEYETTPSQTPNTMSGAEREATIIGPNGMRGPRLVLRAEAPEEPREPDDIAEITLEIWPDVAPTATAEPRIYRGWRAIGYAVQNAHRRIANGAASTHDRAFLIPVDGRTANELERMFTTTGWADGQRPETTSAPLYPDHQARAMTTVGLADLRALAKAAGTPNTAFRPERGLRSFARQRLVTANDTLRRTLADTTEDLLDHAFGLTDSIGNAIDPERVLVRMAPVDGSPGMAAEALARHLESDAVAMQIYRAVARWRRSSRTTTLAASHAGTRRNIRDTVLQTAHRASQRANAHPTGYELTVAPMSALYCDPASTSHNSRPGRSAVTTPIAATVHSGAGHRLPAVQLHGRDGRAHTVAIERLVDIPIAIGAADEQITIMNDAPAPNVRQRAQWTVPDPAALWSPNMRAHALAAHADGTRLGMATGMMDAALAQADADPARMPLIIGIDRSGCAPEHIVPLIRMRTVALDGHPKLYEDGMIVRRGAAARIKMVIEQTLTCERHREGDERAYVGEDAAPYEDVVHDLPDLTREAWQKIDATGTVRPGALIAPGDIIELWRESARNPDTGDITQRYRATPAPTHGVHRVVAVTEDDDNALLADDATPMPSDLLAETRPGLHTVRIRLHEQPQMDEGHKLTTESATKGMIQIVEDHEMPCDADGRPADIAISGASMAGRMSPADQRQLRLGHLLESRALRLLDALERCAAGDAAAYDETAARYARTLSVANAPATPVSALSEVLGIGDIAPGELDPPTARDAFERLRRLGPDLGPDSLLALAIPHNASRTSLRTIERALDYERGEEATIVYLDAADAAAERPMATPAACGVMELAALKHLARKNERARGLRRHAPDVNPVTGQRTETRRIGLMEEDALRSSNAVHALAELRTLSSQSVQHAVATELARGGSGETAIRNAEISEADEALVHLTWCSGIDTRLDSGRVALAPASDDARRIASASEVTIDDIGPDHDPDGQILPHGLADGPDHGPFRSRHVELPVPVVHPLALRNLPGERNALIATLLGIPARTLRQLALRDGQPGQPNNGPTQIRERLRDIETAIASNPEGLKMQAEHYNRDDAQAFRNAIDLLTDRPDLHPSNWIVETVAVPDPRVRPRRNTGGRNATAASHHLDGFIRALVNEADTLRTHPETPSATARMSRRVAAYLQRIDRSLYSKRHMMNRAIEGRRTAFSAAGTIVPASMTEIAPTHVEITARAATAVVGHFAIPALMEAEGIDEATAQARLAQLDRRTLERGHPATLRAWETLRRAAALRTALVMRSPALHEHSAIALEIVVRDERRSPSLVPSNDTAIRLPPNACEGMNADHDGDQIGVWSLIGAVANYQTRRHCGAWNQIRKIGDGSTQSLPKQAARTGLVHTLSAPDTQPSATPRDRLLAWLDNDPGALALAHAAFARLDPKVLTRFDEHATLCPADIDTWVRHFQMRTPAEEGAAARIVGILWKQGFEGCRNAPLNIQLASYEAMSDLWQALLASGQLDHLPAAPTYLPRNAARTDKHRFQRQCAQRFEAIVRLIDEWTRDPEAMHRLARSLDDPDMADNARHAEPILHTLAGGGRLKSFQIVRTCCEAGGPSRITGETYGVYVPYGLIEGSDVDDLMIQVQAGSDGKNANHSVVAKAGFLGQRLIQSVQARTCITTDDCGADPAIETFTTAHLAQHEQRARWTGATLCSPESVALPDGRALHAGHTLSERDLAQLARLDSHLKITLDPISTEPVTPLLEGATLARAAPRARWPKGMILTPEHIREGVRQRIDVQIRDLTRCEAPDGICARCTGTLRATSATHEPGTEAGVVAGSAISELISQRSLRKFHMAQNIGTDELDRKERADAIMRAATRSTWQSETDPENFNPNDPAHGALHDIAFDAHARSGPQGATRAVGHALQAMLDDGVAIDPTHMRVIGYGLAGHDDAGTLDLDRCAAHSNPRRYQATGSSPDRAARSIADGHATRFEHTDRRLERLAGTLESSQHNDAHLAAANDDVRTLRRLAASTDPDHRATLTERNALGWTPLFEARSLEAVRILVDAGCDPLERASHDPRGRLTDEAIWYPNALELLTVRPIEARGLHDMEPGERRRTVLSFILSRLKGRVYQQTLDADPVLRQALQPLGPKQRAERAHPGYLGTAANTPVRSEHRTAATALHTH